MIFMRWHLSLHSAEAVMIKRKGKKIQRRKREYDEVMKDKPDLGCEKEIYDVAYFALEFSAVVMHFSR